MNSRIQVREHQMVELYEEAVCVRNGVGETVARPRVAWADGTVCFHQVRPHVSLHWGAGRFDAELSVRSEVESPVVFLAFAVAGGWREQHCGSAGEFSRVAGQMSLIHGPSLIRHSALRSSSSIHLAAAVSLDQFADYFAEDASDGARRALRLARGEGCPNLTLPMSSRANALVEQVQRCPFQGALRTLAFESHFAELLAEMVRAMSDQSVLGERSCRWLRADEGKIRAAADLLAQQMEQPPSLAALALAVGLGESKLKRGFHRVFGQTAFGYLRTQRMARARQLLETGEATVLEASTLVGYSNPSHFATAFRRQFGVNPKQFQLVASGEKQTVLGWNSRTPFVEHVAHE